MTPKEKYHLFRTNKNFCAAPWTSIHVFGDGDVRTCSIGKTNLGNVKEKPINEILKGDVARSIKRNMLEDKPDKNCVVCQRRTIDDTYFSYYKDHFNSKVLYDDIDYLDEDAFDLRMPDLHWSNVCNLRCVMCTPSQSSLIAKDEGVFIKPVQKDTIEEITKMILEKQYDIKEVYMSGGEPFYIPYNNQLLQKINNKNIPLRINSNMHWDKNNKLFQTLQTFNNVELTMSVDAMGDKFEYIRNGSNWNTFINNLKYVKGNTNFDIRVNSIFSILNAADIGKTIRFFYHDIGIKDVTINLCFDPADIDARNYPEHGKEAIVNELEQLITTLDSVHINLISNLKNCISQIQLPPEHNYKSALARITMRNAKPWQQMFEDLA